MLEHRKIVEEVDEWPKYGVVNTLMVMTTESKDDKGRLRVDKVDAVLNAKPCNSWIQINKEAVDYMRAFMPFISQCQEMGQVLEMIRTRGEHKFGKVDMLNAYSQMWLPEAL